MNRFAVMLKKWLPKFIVYSYQSLVLACFVIFALRFFLAKTAWINHLTVFLVLATVLFLSPYVKNLLHKNV